MNKTLFMISQIICNIVCVVLIGIGADFAKIGDFREWMFITGAVIICVPTIIEFTIWYWKGIWRSCINEKNRN